MNKTTGVNEFSVAKLLHPLVLVSLSNTC